MKYIIFKLLKKSFLIVFFITFFVFFIIVFLSFSIIKYHNYLENSFSNKQNHITITYIKNQNKDDIYKIQKLLQDNLVSYNTFSQTIQTITLKRGAFYYRGRVKIVGLGVDVYPITYNFNNLDIRLDDMYNIRPSGIELFEEFRNSNVEVFNKTLHKSFFNNAPSTLTTYKLNINDKKVDINFGAIVDDMKDELILFMNIKKLNKLLNHNPNYIDGFYLNIKNPLESYKIKQILLKNFNNIYVSTWQEENPKQNHILLVFSKITRLIQFIIAVLGISVIIVIFMNQFIKKQPQLRILNILGMNLNLYINMVLAFIIFSAELLVVLLFFKFLDLYVVIYFLVIPLFVILINNYVLSFKQNLLR